MYLPLAMARDGIPVAAIAETVAYRRCVTLTLRYQRLHVLFGLNIRPPRHMLPNAAAP